jgi:hypothetical protein
MSAFKPRSPPTGGGAEGVTGMGCLELLLHSIMRRAKRILVNQNYHDKFYPHSILTLSIQMATAYNEIGKFVRTWCNGEVNLEAEVGAVVSAIKEIFEAENRDDATWMIELLANKHAIENVDRLIYLVSARH